MSIIPKTGEDSCEKTLLSEDSYQFITKAHNLGMDLLPLKGKKPIEEAWTTRPPLTSEQIVGYFGPREHNIGIRCGRISNIVVVDLDDTVSISWAQKNLPATPIGTRTGKRTADCPDGGLHLFYRHPSSGQVKSCNPTITTDDGQIIKIEVRSDGRQVVAPFSIHPISGELYQAIGEWDTLDDVPVFDPSWVGIKAKPAQQPYEQVDCNGDISATSTGDWYRRNGHTVPQGARNKTLFTAACDYAAMDVDVAKAHHELLSEAMDSGLEYKEASKTIDSAYSKSRTPTQKNRADIRLLTDGFADIGEQPTVNNAYPVDALPDGLRDYVVEVAAKTNAPVAIVGSTVFGVLAACTQNVAVIKRSGWASTQNLSLFLLNIAESAGGKSRGMLPVTKAFRDLQAEKQIEIDRQRKLNQPVVKELQRQLGELFKKNGQNVDLLAAINGTGDCAILRQAQEYQDKIDDLDEPKGGSCLVYDHTVEAALQQMTHTHERAASLDAESRFIDQALGIAYQTSGSPSLIVNCWDGETISNRRVSRGSIVLYRPALTICNGIQPELFHRNYLKKHSFGDSGFLQRFLMVQPAGVFAVTQDGQGINSTMQQAWDCRVTQLASMAVPHAVDETNQRKIRVGPTVVTICADGEQKLREVESWVVEHLKSGLDTQHPRWRSWLGRYVSQVIRIAGLLHVYRHGVGFTDQEICADDVQRAVTIGEFYKGEADRILNGVVVNEASENAQIIQDFIIGRGMQRFTTRDIRNGLHRRIRDDERQSKTQKIRASLRELAEEGVIRLDTAASGETWVTNPALLDGSDQG